ncbi:MAG: hypothetical protein ACYC1L_07595 [Alphaproteobacteria bacterium]
MIAIQMRLAIRALLFVAYALVVTVGPATAGDPQKLRADFLWFVSGHGVNLSEVADDGASPFAITRFVSADEVPPAATARVKIDGIRGAIARLQAPGEHVLPAGHGPAGTNADLTAVGLLAKLGGDADVGEIDLVVGIDLKTGTERTLVRATRDGSLFDPESANPIAAGFLPLYSIGQDRVRIHFKSDGQYHPPIDRTALAPFGSRKDHTFGPHDGSGAMPIALLARLIPSP